MKTKLSNSRSGVTLLFVISMIVLFLLMGTAFVVVSNDHLKAARKRSYVSNRLENNRQLIDQALYDLLRGPSLDNQASILRTHSILGDMYGYGIRSYVNSVEVNSSGQFATIRLQGNLETSNALFDRPLFQRILDSEYVYTNANTGFPNRETIPPVPGFLDGHVLTFVSGPAAGMSTRIVEHQIVDQVIGTETFFEHLFVVSLLPGSEFSLQGLVDNLFTVAGGASSPDQVIINGRPFSGTGAGQFNPKTAHNRPALAGPNPAMVPATFRPNLQGLSLEELITDDPMNPDDGYLTRVSDIPGNNTVFGNSQSINECYDTFDFQNMFLGGIGRGNGGNKFIIPSFHRPELININGNAPYSDFRAFTQPSPVNNINDINQLQVDNTNDGTNDGFWMNIGLSQFTGEDGRRYQPLASYLVMDMGGKVNVNAHGNQSQINSNNRFMMDLPLLNPVRSRGRGEGPAEIDLEPIFGEFDEQRIMEGFTDANGRFTPGRYGIVETAGDPPVPGYGLRDEWSAYKLYGYREASFNNFGTLGRHYQSSPMDIFGRFSFGYPRVADFNDPSVWIGMPVADIESSELVNEVQNSPYEMSFAPGPFSGARDFNEDGFADDTPFTASELQRILRPNDLDVFLLPNRLADVAADTWNNNELNRWAVTTDSYEVPTVFENLSEKLYSILATTPPVAGSKVGVPNSLLGEAPREEIIRANLVNSFVSGPQANAFRRELLAPELRRGLPMDVNRPFGDGLDNNGNGVTDEIFVRSNGNHRIESEEANPITVEELPHPFSTAHFDHDNDSFTNPSSDNDAYLARSIFARQLYMMILLNTEWIDRNGNGTVDPQNQLADWYDFNGDGMTNGTDLTDYRRVVAQWCINVVDFRDPDSICTPFEVDLQPWDGWNVDGDLTTIESTIGDDRHVFWGCERPELLLTETMATHDRRTKDTDQDSSGDNTAGGDAHFDTHLLPVASAFFELYNPWLKNNVNQIHPAEFYDTRNDKTGVDLQKLAVEDGASPVWRMVATTGDNRTLDPDDPTNNPSNIPPVVFSRHIYFVKPGASTSLLNEMAYYPPTNITVNPVEPGRYAVVGSATAEDNDEYITWFGRRRSAAQNDLPADLDLDNTRRIVLNPGGATVEIWDWDSSGTGQIRRTVRGEVVNLPISRNYVPNAPDRVRSLGLSDPIAWYDNVQDMTIKLDIRPSGDQGNGLADGWALYDDADQSTDIPVYIDEPVDQQLQADNYNRFLRFDGLHSAFNTVHLQRLANPLIAYDPVTNPYLTIDSNSVDLFSYNGIDDSVDPNNGVNPITNQPFIERFGSFERRSGNETVAGTEPDQVNGIDSRFRILWKTNLEGKNPENDTDSPEDTTGTDPHVLNRNFVETLGQLNSAYLNVPAGGGTQPFSWLSWNNRPYASELELANVPFTSNYGLSCKYDIADTRRNVYQPPVMDDIRTGAKRYSGRFAHLLNFYADTGENNNSPDAPWLHRIFDYLEVPSRFFGTSYYVRPENFRNDNHDLYSSFAAPFDTISYYRNPGKININTITDERVWNALMGTYNNSSTVNGNAGVPYSRWQASINGKNNPFTNFANPYRASYAFNLVPDQSLIQDGTADCGLFRRVEGATGGGLGAASQPLFALASTNQDITEAAKRSAYARNDMRQRLGNLATNRSSVFAIWITIGFFEVNEDGTFGAEQGLESGENTTRSRAFFVLDRSIPVAFEPGKNHNIEKAIRVSSFIE